jgi:hypothetical protein
VSRSGQVHPGEDRLDPPGELMKGRAWADDGLVDAGLDMRDLPIWEVAAYPSIIRARSFSGPSWPHSAPVAKCGPARPGWYPADDAHAAKRAHSTPLCRGRPLLPMPPVWPAARRANQQAPPDDVSSSSPNVFSRTACVRTGDRALGHFRRRQLARGSLATARAELEE